MTASAFDYNELGLPFTQRWSNMQFVTVAGNPELSLTEDAMSIESTIVRLGANSTKVVVGPGYFGIPSITSTERSEFGRISDAAGAEIKPAHGETMYLGLSIYLGTDWVQNVGQFNIYWQMLIDDLSAGWTNPAFALETHHIAPHYWKMIVNCSDTAGVTKNQIAHPINVNVTLGQWVDFAFEFFFSSTVGTLKAYVRQGAETSYVQTYESGVISMWQRAVNGSLANTGAHKQGLYRGVGPQIQTIYHDAFIIGTTLADVQFTLPNGGEPPPPPAPGNVQAHYDFTRPTLGLATVLGPGPVYTANTTPRSYFSQLGDLTLAVNDVPRLASYLYQSAVWENRGYIGEGAATNEAIKSKTPIDWASQQFITRVNDVTGIDGVSFSGTTITDDATTNFHRVYQVADKVIAADQLLAFSAYFKAGTRGFMDLSLRADIDNAHVRQHFNLNDITVGTEETSGTVVVDSKGIMDIGGGWMYAWVVAAVNDLTAEAISMRIELNSDTEVEVYLGTVETIIVDAIQCEEAEFTSSWIPTLASGVVRNKDDLTAILTTISTKCTILLQATTPNGDASGVDQVLLEFNDGDTTESIVVRRTDGTLHVVFRAGGAEVANLNMGAVADNTNFELGLACDTNDFAASLDGAAVVTDAAGAAPTGLTDLYFAQDGGKINQWYGATKQEKIFNTREANGVLQAPFAPGTDKPDRLIGGGFLSTEPGSLIG